MLRTWFMKQLHPRTEFCDLVQSIGALTFGGGILLQAVCLVEYFRGSDARILATAVVLGLPMIVCGGLLLASWVYIWQIRADLWQKGEA